MRTLLLVALVACGSSGPDLSVDPFAVGSCDGSSWVGHGDPVTCDRECAVFQGDYTGPPCTGSDGSGVSIMCAHTFVGSDGYQGCCTIVQPDTPTFFECK